MSDSPRPLTGAAALPVLEAAERLEREAQWLEEAVENAHDEVRSAFRRFVAPQVDARLSELPEGRRDDETRRRIQSSVQVRLRHAPADAGLTRLIVTLARWDAVAAASRRLRPLVRQVLPALAADLPAAEPVRNKLKWVFAERELKEASGDAFNRLRQVVEWADQRDVHGLIAGVRKVVEQGVSESDAWAGYLADPAGTSARLADAVDQRPEEAGIAGLLPEDAAAAVDAQELDTSLLAVELRSYQRFGARFALARRKAVIADELGLGKRVQALAAMAHLRATGASHCVVVCPAGLAPTWLREAGRLTTVPVHDLTGSAHRAASVAWRQGGGVAVIADDDLPELDLEPADLVGGFGMLVVDEADTVTDTGRPGAEALAALTGKADRVLLLTGAPLERRPTLARRLATLLGVESDVPQRPASLEAFRAATASFCLRRTPADVVAELPDVVRTDVWTTWAGLDAERYRDAVVLGNFSGMRRAAYPSADPDESAKVARLVDLVAQARDDGRPVVIFSHFLSVLTIVVAALTDAGNDDVLGPLTSATPADQRTAMLDAFAAPGRPSVICVQVDAGDDGGRLRAASVLLWCEPQVKPLLEKGAVDRCRRDGDLEPLFVYRVLVDHSVDEHMLDIIAHRQRMLDEQAREAGTQPELADVSEMQMARRIVADEQIRLGVGMAARINATPET
ncbi:SNF2-related protein [Nigerium massiliense]|uniref:SNF2-related protein n=1 Tax=Nigerium massiliense TaxID=1522317 RepID=UPI00069502F0|nr:DEAD/DEAH box helicase [Nigerium massiliense]